MSTHLLHQVAYYHDKKIGDWRSVHIRDLQPKTAYEEALRYPLYDESKQNTLVLCRRGGTSYLRRIGEARTAGQAFRDVSRPRDPFHSERQRVLFDQLIAANGPVTVFTKTKAGFRDEGAPDVLPLLEMTDYTFEIEAPIVLGSERAKDGGLHRIIARADLVGRPRQLATDRHHAKAFIVETINDSPPSRPVFEGYLAKSSVDHMIVAFDFRSNPNPASSNYYLHLSSNALRVRYYITEGMFWENDEPMPDVDYDQFLGIAKVAIGQKREQLYQGQAGTKTHWKPRQG